MIKAIIFDYDGVIVDSFTNIYEVYKVICKKLNKKCPDTIDGFRKIYGDTFLDLYRNLKIETQEEKEKAEVIYKEEVLKREPQVFNGIIETIKKLHKKYQLVLITSNYREEAVKKLNKFGILNYFTHIIGKTDDTPTNLRKTEEMKKIVKIINLREEEIVTIGDRSIDYKEAKEAGLNNILLVDYGWGYDLNQIPEYKPKFIIKKPEDILKAIENLDI